MIGRWIGIVAAAAALLSGSLPSQAGNPARREGSARLVYGIEWGYDATVLEAHHYNYTDSEDGFRIDESAARPMLYSNAHATAHLTVEFAKHWAFGLYAGYAGIQERTRMFPFALRSTYHSGSFREDGSFYFLEGGAGPHETRSSVSPYGRLGYGYRLILGGRTRMDFSGSLRMTFDHPPIYDNSIPGYIPQENIRRSDALYGALCVSVALNF